LHKGSPIFIEGRLQSRSWEDNSGQKRNVLEIRVERVQFLGGAPARGGAGQPEEQSQEPSPESTETSWLEESEDKSNAS
ncbi:MAG: single-stranded DNA-binding protein, partial [Candidatus Omnitrophota bacterium]